MTIKKNVINNIDVIEGLKQLPDNSIDCIIADPPYNIGKDFGNNSDKQELILYIQWCEQFIKEFERVIKPSGTGFIYGFSEILAHLSVKLTLPQRWLIWHYTNKNAPLATYWQRSHESIISFWKDSNLRIYNQDATREPYTDGFIKGAAGKQRKPTKGRFSDGITETTYNANVLGAMGRDVIKIPSLAGGGGIPERIYYCHTCDDIFMGNKKEHKEHKLSEHPTQKPQELTKKLIQSTYKNQEDFTVLIPFAGSGSEAVYCKMSGIDFYSYELNEEYANFANKLIKKYSVDTTKKEKDVWKKLQ
jgi:site-specific DNA-methyltransferase (adenine-specific)